MTTSASFAVSIPALVAVAYHRSNDVRAAVSDADGLGLLPGSHAGHLYEIFLLDTDSLGATTDPKYAEIASGALEGSLAEAHAEALESLAENIDHEYLASGRFTLDGSEEIFAAALSMG
jgi:hypothetical protein